MSFLQELSTVVVQEPEGVDVLTLGLKFEEKEMSNRSDPIR